MHVSFMRRKTFMLLVLQCVDSQKQKKIDQRPFSPTFSCFVFFLASKLAYDARIFVNFWLITPSIEQEIIVSKNKEY